MLLRDSDPIRRRFGIDLASELLSAVRQLEEEFYTSDAQVVAADLQEMEKLCAEQFRERNPGIAEEIVKAFASLVPQGERLLIGRFRDAIKSFDACVKRSNLLAWSDAADARRLPQ